MLRYLFSIAGALLFATVACGETVTYVRTVSTTNFLGWGQDGFYFPQFAASSVVGPKRTDDNMQFFVPNWLEFNFDPWDFEDTTFSADKPDCFDNCSGRGVYTRGGYSHWDAFTLPNGFSGPSGSVVDEKAENNSNNTVNQITMKNGVPSSFCMHIVTDNTANAHDSAHSIIVRVGRPGQGSFDPNAAVPNLSFDGTTDVHTFRFDDFLPDDFIKIRLNSGVPGVDPGFGGLMFDEDCDYIPNQRCGDNICDVTRGESCESCPGDCGDCIPGPTPTRDWVHHGPDPKSHYVEGANRLLIFAAHGVDDSSHWVQGVKYGNKDMHFLEARSQDRNDKATVSVWYLKEAGINPANGSNFSVDWYHKPGQRSYESIFFTNVSQTFSFGAVDEAGCNDCYAMACPWRTMEPGHISLYAGTHERDGAVFWPLNDYIQDADLWMGGNGKATLGHKNGIGNMESAGAQFGREGAFSLVCFEVQDIPRTLPQPDSDGDGLSDALETLIGTLVNDSDTDNDGVTDYDEVNFDGDAFDYNPATDLNPFDVDTDGDGADDANELSAGTDPLDDSEVPPTAIAAASLPSSRSVEVGNMASAFATIMNGNTTAATGCSITPQTSVAASFAYQATDASNVPTGVPNTPADIPAGGSQNFIFAFVPTEPISPIEVLMTYDCLNSEPAQVTVGLNTLLLSASSSPVPDIVAMASTPSGDGILNLSGTSSSNAFAVATVNVGSTATITASPRTSVPLNVTLTICETIPSAGTCMSAPGRSTTSPVSGGATPMYSVFVTAAGNVPFDPANNRIIVEFKDAGGVVRGATSVAVRTQ